jgi:hypothetical protein
MLLRKYHESPLEIKYRPTAKKPKKDLAVPDIETQDILGLHIVGQATGGSQDILCFACLSKPKVSVSSSVTVSSLSKQS